MPREQVVQRGGEGVDIGPGVHATVGPQRLGRSPRQRDGRRRPARRALGGDAEVGEPGRSVLVGQDVVGLEVPVQDARRVRRLQRAAHLDADPEHLLEAEAVRAQPIRERAVGVVLHDQVRTLVGRHAREVHGHDVRVFEGRHRIRLVDELVADRRGIAVPQDLHRHLTSRHPLGVLVDDRLAPLPEDAHMVESGDLGRAVVGHRAATLVGVCHSVPEPTSAPTGTPSPRGTGPRRLVRCSSPRPPGASAPPSTCST